MNGDIWLKFVKALLNWPMRLLDKFLPERQPSFPQTEIVDRMYKRMFQAYRLEQAQGVFMEHLRVNGEGYDATIQSYADWLRAVEAMPKRQFNGDGNFERLLRVSRKILLIVGEDDRYYRAWLGMGLW